MSWTTVSGHRPAGPPVYERPLGNQNAPLDHTSQMCSCGEPYDCQHVGALVID